MTDACTVAVLAASSSEVELLLTNAWAVGGVVEVVVLLEVVVDVVIVEAGVLDVVVVLVEVVDVVVDVVVEDVVVVDVVVGVDVVSSDPYSTLGNWM